MNFPMETKIVGLVNTSGVDNYIYGKGKNYIIPEYQREYSWGEIQIESFVTSIKRAIEGESVFMGTVQFAYESKIKSELHIIDGQQRMTTFLLLCNVLEKQTGIEILSKNNMRLSIKNFESNNNKLIEALNINYEEIEMIESSNNRYIENTKILKHSVEELEQEYPVDKIISAIDERIYFVELVTKDIPLPQVVGIFNTINTTGLDLNCSDLFKLQYYEYLKKTYPEEVNWMRLICNIYEKVNKEKINMNNILDIYKHCIVAKYKLGWEMLSKSNESFFEEIFNKKEPEQKSEMLKFREFNKIVEIYLDLSEKVYSVKAISAFASDVIWMTRYGRYWTLPYVAAYFNDGDYETALNSAMEVAKYFVVCSVNFDKVINPVQTFMCNKVLPAISKNENVEGIVQDVICEAPYEWRSDYPEWNKTEFVNRIKKDLFYNGKRAYIICTLSALIEEMEVGTKISEIKKKLFDWKNCQYDMEHICARNIFENTYSENISEYNGIGNLVVLNRSINRGIGDKDVGEKVKEYKGSTRYEKEPRFAAVENVVKQIEAAGNLWGIEQVRNRAGQQKKLLCEFLGLD